MKANGATRTVHPQLPYKRPKNVASNLEFQLYNIEIAAIRVHALFNSPWRIRLILSLTGVDAYSSVSPFLYNTVE